MRMGQGVRTGLGHGGIASVLQTHFLVCFFFSILLLRSGLDRVTMITVCPLSVHLSIPKCYYLNDLS